MIANQRGLARAFGGTLRGLGAARREARKGFLREEFLTKREISFQSVLHFSFNELGIFGRFVSNLLHRNIKGLGIFHCALTYIAFRCTQMRQK